MARRTNLAETARDLGICGVNPGGTLARFEIGSRQPDADMIERIRLLSGGLVSAGDMQAVRLAWLRAHRPEKFACDIFQHLSAPLSSSPGGAESAPDGPPVPSGADPVMAPDQTESGAPACPANSEPQTLRATMPPTGLSGSRFAGVGKGSPPCGISIPVPHEVRT